MKKLLTGIISILASSAMILPGIALPAGSNSFLPVRGLSASALSDTDTAKLKLTNAAAAGDEFIAYKIINITYDSTTNTVSYDWADEIKSYITGFDGVATTSFTVEEYRAFSTEKRRSVLAGIYSYMVENNLTSTLKASEAVAVKSGSAVTATFADNLTMGGYLISSHSSVDVYQIAFKAVEPTPNASGLFELTDKELSLRLKHNPLDIVKKANKTNVQTNEIIKYTIVADIPKYGANAIGKWFSVKDVPPAGVTIINNEDYPITVYSLPAGKEQNVDENWDIMTEGTDYSYSTITDGTLLGGFKIDVTNTPTLKQYDKWYKYSVSDDGGKFIDITKGDVHKSMIKVEYYAYLNDEANLATLTSAPSGGYNVGMNQNTATLTFYPFPYTSSGESGIKTAEKNDSEYVYTYGAKIFKYESGEGEEESTALPGATFRLYSDEAATTLVTGYYYKDGNASEWTKADEDTDLVTDSEGLILIKGIKGGTKYYIKEIAPPAGYNMPSNPISDIDTAFPTDGGHALNAAYHGTGDYKSEAVNGYVLKEVENNKGFTLPETGGTGVLILKILGVIGMGAAIVVVSIVLFAPKKKAGKVK